MEEIKEELLKSIVRGYLYTNAGAKKLSWFYEVDIKIVKEIIKDIKLGKYKRFENGRS